MDTLGSMVNTGKIDSVVNTHGGFSRPKECANKLFLHNVRLSLHNDELWRVSWLRCRQK